MTTLANNNNTSNNNDNDNDSARPLTVMFRGNEIPVSWSSAVTRDEAVKGLASEPFQTWLQRCMHGTGNTTQQLCVHSIEIQSVDMFGPRFVSQV